MNGILVAENGTFNLDLPFGEYYAVIEFSGYPSFTTNSFSLPL